MQDVDGLRATRDIDHSLGAALLRHANLFDAPADRGHWLEVIRLLSALHFVQLKARVVASVLWELSQPLERVPEEGHWLHFLIISEWI